MAYSIQAATEADAAEWNETFWTAFHIPDADMIMPMIYGCGWTDQVEQHFNRRYLNALRDNKETGLFTCARDNQTQQIVGVARWAIEKTARNIDDIRKEHEEFFERRKQDPVIEGSNRVLGDAFMKAMFDSSLEHLGGRPHVELQLLAVRPEYHGRGVGTLLLKVGLEEADKLGLPVYLDASRAGKPLYEKHGFEVVAPFPFDGRKYGGDCEGRHWIMLRPGKQ